MTEKKNETSTDKFETGCGCLFMLVPAFIVYCLLSAFLVFPAGWNVSEVFENKVVHKVLMVLLLIVGLWVLITGLWRLWSGVRSGELKISHIKKIFGLQMFLICVAILCGFIASEIHGGGCIIGLSIFRLCIIDSILLTLLASIGTTAGGYALALIGAYFHNQ